MMSDKSITVINVGGTYLEIPESLSAEDKVTMFLHARSFVIDHNYEDSSDKISLEPRSLEIMKFLESEIAGNEPPETIQINEIMMENNRLTRELEIVNNKLAAIKSDKTDVATRW
jgi:hypothetical protein